MNKKKINILVVISMLVLYLICAGTITWGMAIQSKNEFVKDMEKYENDIWNKMSKCKSNKEGIWSKQDQLKAMCEIDGEIDHDLHEYAVTFLYDEDGQYIGDTYSNYHILGNEDYYYLNVNSFLTKEQRKEINNMCLENLESFGPRIYYLKYYIDEGDVHLLDFKFVMDAYDKNELPCLEFNFSKPDEKIDTDSIIEEECDRDYYSCGGTDYWWMESEAYNKHYISYEKTLDEMQDKVGMGNSMYIDGYYISVSEGLAGPMKIIAYHSVANELLSSFIYKTSIVMLFAIFFIITILLIIVFDKVYDKNEQINIARDAFTKGVAHDMKTPLAIIRNLCECIMEGVAPEKNDEYIESIYDEAGRMNDEVLSFMQYNRLSVTSEIDKEKINLSDLINDQIERHMQLAEGKELDIKTDICENMYYEGNRELLEIAVANYLSNAIKYTMDKAKIDINLKEGMFEVLNESTSFGLNDINGIWEVMSRGDRSRNRDDNSSGMGLPITAHICRLHRIKNGVNIITDPEYRIKRGVRFYMEF